MTLTRLEGYASAVLGVPCHVWQTAPDCLGNVLTVCDYAPGSMYSGGRVVTGSVYGVFSFLRTVRHWDAFVGWLGGAQ